MVPSLSRPRRTGSNNVVRSALARSNAVLHGELAIVIVGATFLSVGKDGAALSRDSRVSIRR